MSIDQLSTRIDEIEKRLSNLEVSLRQLDQQVGVPSPELTGLVPGDEGKISEPLSDQLAASREEFDSQLDSEGQNVE